MGPTATGNGSGSDWNNIQAVPPSWSLTRGDTYYLSDGTYGAVTFANVTGSTISAVIKATASDFGSSCSPSIAVGWNLSTMGSGVAHFIASGTVWSVASHDLVFDGMRGTGKSTHGIWLDSNSTSDGVAAILISANGQNITYRHIEANNAPALNSNGSRVYHSGSITSSNDTFQYNYFHGGRMWIGMVAGGTSNHLIEHNYFANAGSGDPSLHSAGFGLADVTNVTIRYNVMENMLGGSNTTYIEPQFTSTGVDVYGNVFWATSPNESTGQGIYAVTSTDHSTNSHIYNNTIVGLHTFSGIWCGNTSGQQIFVDNNLWQSNAASPSITGQSGATCTVGANNSMDGGASFVNQSGGDFHLTAHTADATNLPSPYTLDPDGVTRGGASGAWDRGAYEFAMSSSKLGAPTNLTAQVK